jgi:hypothetical protein
MRVCLSGALLLATASLVACGDPRVTDATGSAGSTGSATGSSSGHGSGSTTSSSTGSSASSTASSSGSSHGSATSGSSGSSGMSNSSTGSGSGGSGGQTLNFTTTLTEETANDTSASPRFVDDYVNFATSAQSDSSNGDAVAGARIGPVDRGVVSKVPLQSLLPAGAPTRIVVETQTWFCHLASNEADGGALIHNARCGSHIDIGENSDDPLHVHRQVQDMVSRGLGGVLMDWSGKESNSTLRYPTTLTPTTGHARSSTEVCTNAIYAFMHEAEQQPQGAFTFAVLEDEGITNCRNGWAGGCACWPAYGATCDVTSQVISDLNDIASRWAGSPAYLQWQGQPAVFFFSPDYNACPDAASPSCQHINWTAVRQLTPPLRWVFTNRSGFTHADSAGAFAWFPVPGLYPTGDPSFGQAYLRDFDTFASSTSVPAGDLVVASAFKGFDDGVTNGWSYDPAVNHTRYINQRCGRTWLETFQLDDSFWRATGAPALPLLQIGTWDDYEEGTEIESGIDACINGITLAQSGTVLSWSTAFGHSLTDASIVGSEVTLDHYTVYASLDGEHLAPLGGVLGRDARGNLTHTLDLAPFALAPGTYSLRVKATGKPALHGAISSPVTFLVP